MRGPTKGTDNKKKLDGRVVVITGSKLWLITVEYFDLRLGAAHSKRWSIYSF